MGAFDHLVPQDDRSVSSEQDRAASESNGAFDRFLPKSTTPTASNVSSKDSAIQSLGQYAKQAVDVARDVGTAVTGLFKPDEASLPVSESTSPRVVDTGGLPIDQGVFTQLKAELGAMPREQRLATVNLPGWKGRAAKVAIEQLDNEQAGVDRLKIGSQSPTLEGRAGFYAGQGASHEVAQSKATSDLVSGAPGGKLHFAQDGGATAAADAQARAEGQELQNRSIGVRAGYAASEGFKAGSQGVAAAAMRAMGDDETANALELSARRSKIRVDSVNELVSMRRRAQEDGTVAGHDGFWEDMSVGGLSSAAQNAPQIGAGVAMSMLTKNPAAGTRLAMSLMTGQSFGDEYINGRMAGMTPGKAASRAGIMAGFEYLGERYGLIPSAMKAVRGNASKVPLEELPQFLERFVGALEKRGVLGPQVANVARGQLGEQFGEQLTTAGQYWIDGTGLGLDKPVSISGYLEAARDTAIQTLIATGALQGAGAGASHVVLGKSDRQSERSSEYQADAAQDRAIDKWQHAFAIPTGEQSGKQTEPSFASTSPAGRLDDGELSGVTGLADDGGSMQIEGVQQGSLASAALAMTTPVDEAAHQAATSPTNDLAEPTQAQKEAGNYKVGRARIAGMDIRIENPEGSVRKGVDADGQPWETQMQHHYGYFSGTMAADGDKLDVFVKPGLSEDWSGPVFVIDQVDPSTGKLDEHKVVMGAADEAEAEQIYRSNYADDWQGLGAVTRLPLPAFKAWSKSGRFNEPLGDIAGQVELAKNRKLASSANTAKPDPAIEPTVERADTAPVVASPTIAGKPVTELQTGQLLRYAKMASASERVRRVAAEEVKRRETEAMWNQREQERQAQEASIVSEAQDQQVVQAIAASNASETDAPTAMAAAFSKALNKKDGKHEQNAQEAPGTSAAPQAAQKAVDPEDHSAPEVGAEPTGVSGARPAATEAVGLTEAEEPRHDVVRIDVDADESPFSFLDESDPVGDSGGGVSFRRISGRIQNSDGTSISEAELRDVIDGAAKGWKGISRGQMLAVESWRDLPEEVLQEAERLGFNLSKIDGFLHRGRAYLVRSAIKDQEHAERIVFHEVLGHLGVRAALGGKQAETLNAIWNKMNGLAGVAKLAKQHETSPGVSVWQRLQPYIRGTEGADPAYRRSVIMDELIAYLVEANDTTALTQFKGYLANVKASVVKLLRRFGLKTLADKLENSGSEFDALALVRDARSSIVTGKTREGKQYVFVSQGQALNPAFSEVNDSKFSVRDDSPVNLPEAIIGATLGAESSHPDYVAAKRGDTEAAFRLANDLVTDEMAQRVLDSVGSDVIVQPVVAEESGGRNKIPHAVAEVLADRIGAQTAMDIVQSSRAYRTSMDGLGRIFATPEFSGPVETTKPYLLVDDTLTQGGTFASLASHITQNGGQVAGLFALTGKQYSAKLTPPSDLIAQVREKFADVEPAFRAATGRGFDSLTESEARHLVKHKSPESVRDRISEAGRQASEHQAQGNDQGQQEGLTGNAPRFSVAPDDHDPLKSALEKAGIRNAKGAVGRTKDRIASCVSNALALIHDRNRLAVEFQQGFLDQFTGIDRAVKREIGSLPTEQDPYVTARLANGGTSAVMRGLLMHGKAKWANNGQHLEKVEGSKGLLEILEPLGDNLNEWFAWMIGNRAARLKNEGRENLFDAAEIAAMQGLSDGRKDMFVKAALQYADFKKSVLDVAQGAGLIDAEARKAWDHADYIPFYRQIDERASFSPTGRKGLAGQSSGVRTLKGGDGALNDPMENLLMNFSRLIDASLKNNALLKTVDVLGKSDVIQRVGYDMTGAVVPKAQIEKVLEDSGVTKQVMSVIPQAAFDGMAKMWSIQAPTAPDVIRVMRGGRPEFYRVEDPLLLKALTSFVPFDFPGLAAARWFKRTLTHAITSTPEFMLRNFIRDTAASKMISRDKFKVFDSIKGVVESYRESGAGEAMLFAGASFQSGNVNAADPASTAISMRRALRKRGMDASSVDTFMGTILDKGLAGWEKYRELGEAVENANREAIYKATLASGKSATDAAFESKDLMDFSLRGSSPLYQLMADTLPFLNARVQGLYRLGRSDPKRLVAYGMVMLAASLVLAAANGGDDWYEELPDWDKDTFWHIRVHGHHFRIPKPFELGVVFATVPERILRYLRSQDAGSKTAERLWSNLRDQLAFDIVPQIARPALDLYSNKDPFRDSPIEGVADEGKLPHLRYAANTSATMKALTGAAPGVSDMMGASPKRLEYLVGGYFGTVGMYALGISDMAVRAMQDAPPGPSWRADDIPVIKAFYRADPARATVFESDLYKTRDVVEKIYKSVAALRKEGRDDEADSMEYDNLDKLTAREVIDQAAKDLSELTRERNAIYLDRSMTPAEKRKALDANQIIRNSTAKSAMTDDAVKAVQ